MRTGGAEIITTYAIAGGASPAVMLELSQLQTGQNNQQAEIEQLQTIVGPGGNLDAGTF